MEKRIIKINNTNQIIYVYWVLSDFCNQHCSYCPKELHSGHFHSQGYPFKKDIDSLLDKLIDTSKQKNKKIHISIAGGEPTLHPELPYILDRLKPHSFIEIITNGTRNVTWWETIKSLPDRIIITLHPEYYNSKKTRIDELSTFLFNNKIDFQFNLMCHPNQWDTVMEILNDIPMKFRPRVSPKMLLDYENPDTPLLYPYTEKQLNFVKHYQTIMKLRTELPVKSIYSDGSVSIAIARKIIASNEHHFQNWKCSAGVDSISVQKDGTVRAGICGAQQLGRMDNFKFLDEYIDCPRSNCPCPADIILDKYSL